MKPKLMVTVGIPASGKSRWSDIRKDATTALLSSDELREELFNDVNNQDNNGDVFKTLYERARYALRNGLNVIVDATNIQSKRRIALINDFKNENCEFEAHYFNTLYDVCVHRNSMRDRTVPDRVLERMYKELQVPQYSEGWDNIVIHTDEWDSYNFYKNKFNNSLEDFELYKFRHFVHDNFCFSDLNYIQFCSTLEQMLRKPDFDSIYEIGQDSSYHSFTITRHTYHVWKYLFEKYNTFDLEDREKMLLTAVLHDVGKGFCKNFKEGSRYANFISHENVSAQLACYYLKSLGYDDLFTLSVVELVQLHMRLMNVESDKSKEKLLKQVGKYETYRNLEIFHEADTKAK